MTVLKPKLTTSILMLILNTCTRKSCRCLWSVHSILVTELDIAIQTNPDRSYCLTFGGKSFHVSGEIHEEGEGVKLTCSVDGVFSKADVVLNNSTVHVFSSVSHQCNVLVLQRLEDAGWSTNLPSDLPWNLTWFCNYKLFLVKRSS